MEESQDNLGASLIVHSTRQHGPHTIELCLQVFFWCCTDDIHRGAAALDCATTAAQTAFKCFEKKLVFFHVNYFLLYNRCTTVLVIVDVEVIRSQSLSSM